ncbi:hypothetical protein niasHS_007521 [Heterodera schachtii]|uniref:Dynactin subunit 5 n=1 Tax=Heterodera schachtii TaxID=97005 RepID=A0ABD2JXQ5_HETSC
MEPQIVLYDPSEYIVTSQGNTISRKAKTNGTQNIILTGNSILMTDCILRGDLAYIRMGKYCIIGEGSIIRPPYKYFSKGFTYFPVHFGDYVFIERGCVVVAAYVGSFVHIGQNSIVGQNCVVKDCCFIQPDSVLMPDTVVPPFSIVGGNPARVLAEWPPTCQSLMVDACAGSVFLMLPTIKWLNGPSDDCPSSKLFLLDSDSFSLFRVNDKPPGGSAAHLAGPSAFSVDPLVSSCSPLLQRQEQELVRSFSLDHTRDNRLAIGFTSGRISVVSANTQPGVKYLRGEDIREAQKGINCLDWNFNDSSRLCAAYERNRGTDHAVVVYDLNRTTRNVRELPMSIFEANFAEKVLSVCWFRDDPNLLLINASRGIRIADIREHGNFHSTLSVQNPLMGLCSEPNFGFRFACFAHNLVFVYDRRSLGSAPLHEIEACSNSKVLNKLAWHNRRLFHLTALAKDCGNLFNFSISSSAFSDRQKNLTGAADPSSNIYSQLDPSQRKGLDVDGHSYGVHFYSLPGVSSLTSFDWHPTISDRLALLPVQEKPMDFAHSIASTKRIAIIKLRDDVNSVIGPSGDFCISAGPQLNFENGEKLLAKPNCTSDIDTETLLKRRVLAGYGYGNSLNALATLLEYSKKAIERDQFASDDLRFCWDWLWMQFQSADANEVQKNYGTMFAGVKHILKGTKSNSTIKQDEITYRNRARFDEIATQNGVFGITRAAALALFSVQGMLSKEYLTHLSEFTHSREFAETWCRSPAFVTNYQRMADTVLNILQKYDGVRVPNYESVCEGLTGDDYLLAIVKFLARRDKIYNRIYNEIFESKMALKDKLAFAAIHMDDDFLGTALERLVERLTLEFPLTTLFVNGLDDQTESHQLLHRYLDLTGDLQTVSLLLVIGNCFRGCAAFREETPNSPVGGVKAAELLECAIEAEPRGSLRRKSLHCFRDYLELLNRWKFWLVKTFICSFLRPKNATGGNERPKTMAVQAVIACTFCGSPIYPTVAERIENLRLYTPKMSSFPRRHGPTRTRTISCLCRKPLPKCMICRKHIGGALEPEMVAQSEEGNAVAASAIDHWVVWCGSCNHGGHLAHVRDWFSEYSMCAVSGCECNCVKRDNQLSDGLMMDASVVGRRGNDWQ